MYSGANIPQAQTTICAIPYPSNGNSALVVFQRCVMPWWYRRSETRQNMLSTHISVSFEMKRSVVRAPSFITDDTRYFAGIEGAETLAIVVYLVHIPTTFENNSCVFLFRSYMTTEL